MSFSLSAVNYAIIGLSILYLQHTITATGSPHASPLSANTNTNTDTDTSSFLFVFTASSITATDIEGTHSEDATLTEAEIASLVAAGSYACLYLISACTTLLASFETISEILALASRVLELVEALTDGMQKEEEEEEIACEDNDEGNGHDKSRVKGMEGSGRSSGSWGDSSLSVVELTSALSHTAAAERAAKASRHTDDTSLPILQVSDLHIYRPSQPGRSKSRYSLLSKETSTITETETETETEIANRKEVDDGNVDSDEHRDDTADALFLSSSSSSSSSSSVSPLLPASLIRTPPPATPLIPHFNLQLFQGECLEHMGESCISAAVSSPLSCY